MARDSARRVHRRLMHGGVGRQLVALDFMKALAGTGIDRDHALRAWREQWSFLRELDPTLSGRMATCGWCGILFYRYHRNDLHCSAACRLCRQILWRHQDTLVELVTNSLRRLEAFKAELQSRFGDSAGAFERSAKAIFSQLLRPVLGDSADHFAFPADASDPQAFLAVWRFTFDATPASWRMSQCPGCDILFWRYRRSQSFCSRRCRARRRRPLQ